MKEYLREIVQRAAPRDGVNIMREYLQARILEGLQESGAWASLAFMGGTSLRFLYRLPRFSEDLLKNQSLPDPGWGSGEPHPKHCAHSNAGYGGGCGSHCHTLLRIGIPISVVVSSGKARWVLCRRRRTPSVPVLKHVSSPPRGVERIEYRSPAGKQGSL